MELSRSLKIQKRSSFNEYLESWIEKYKAPKVKPKTLQSFRTAVKFILITFGETPIEKITGDDIQDLLIHTWATRLRDLCKINCRYSRRLQFKDYRQQSLWIDRNKRTKMKEGLDFLKIGDYAVINLNNMFPAEKSIAIS